MIYFVDCEFSNLDPIVSDVLSINILIDDGKGVVYNFYEKYAPTSTKYWSQEAETVHGISYAIASREKPQNKLCVDLLAIFKKYPCTSFVCHTTINSWFSKTENRMSWAWIDYYVLEWNFRRYGNVYTFFKYIHPNMRVSTIELAKQAGHQERKLNVLCDYYGIELNHHDVESDTKATRELYWLLQNEKKSKPGQRSRMTRKNSGSQKQISHQEKLFG